MKTWLGRCFFILAPGSRLLVFIIHNSQFTIYNSLKYKRGWCEPDSLAAWQRIGKHGHTDDHAETLHRRTAS
jgi:hypothetical protein